MEQAGIKSARLLEIYSRLNEGAVLKKTAQLQFLLMESKMGTAQQAPICLQ